MKTIGIIGGMSWQSTAQYYAAINTEINARLGALHSAKIIMHSVDFQPIEECQKKGDWAQAAHILIQAAQSLQAAGADFILLATNTMHVVAQEIASAISIPFVHIAEPTAKVLIADGVTKVGLLGTRLTMEMGFYKDRLVELGLTPIVPNVDHTNLNAIIFNELCHGIIRPESRATYVQAIERMAAQGAQAVILGCTELGLLLSDDDSPLPLYDTTLLHSKAAVDLALSA